MDIKELGGRLAEVLADDKNILLRRAELSAELTALKAKYPSDARYIAYVERAIEIAGLGEEFLREDREPSGERTEFIARMKALLVDNDMQERQAEMVVEMLAGALGWNDAPAPSVQTAATAIAASPEPAPRPAVEVPEGAVWTCGSCGTKNTGRYCIICGASTAEAVAVEQPAAEVAPARPLQTPVVEPIVEPVAPEAMTQQSAPRSSGGPLSSLKYIVLGVVVLLVVMAVGYLKVGIDIEKEAQGPARVTTPAQTEKPTPKEEAPAKKKNVVDDASPKQVADKSPLKTELGLGVLELNQTVDTMHDRLGRENSKEYKNNRTWYHYDDLDVIVKGNYISALESNSSRLKTRRGLHEGSTMDDVKELYGNDYMVTDYNGLLLLEYDYPAFRDQRGILRFAIDKSNGKVKYISIRIPE